jgi:hypothetical protein
MGAKMIGTSMPLKCCGLRRFVAEGLGLFQMTRPVKCPMTVPFAGETACRALVSVGLSQRAAPTSQRFALRCPGRPHHVPNIISVRETALPSTPADVSSSFSQTLETRSGKIVRPKSSKAHQRCIVETVETRQRIRITAATPAYKRPADAAYRAHPHPN